MRNSNRLFPTRQTRRGSRGLLNLVAILTIVAILSGILLYFTNEKQQEQILNTYCGDYGIYGKTLTLMKDGTFRFYYHGCSQDFGYVAGNWVSKNNRFVFTLSEPDKLLDTEYLKISNDLIPVNLSSEKFTSCDHYTDPSERTGVGEATDS